MIGGAVQNIIALSDSVFLYHLSEADFAAMGFVGVFYLLIAAIGYGFSKGGQILIARRAGEGRPAEIGKTFYTLLYFELALALVLFLFMKYGCSYFFYWFVHSESIYLKSLAYLDYRSWGVFLSYAGVAIIALYTGVARTKFIIYDTLILAVVNIILNYGLIFGNFGLPAMGIAGAGLASTIAEAIAFVVFLIYIIFDKENRAYQLFRLPELDFNLIRKQLKLASPIVVQAIIGMGSWFVFFSIVENMGERPLAITNLGRMVYLVLSIPIWGFAAGINTIVSHFIGNHKRMAVLPMVWKTAKITFVSTMLISIPIISFPEFFLYPVLGSQDMSLITESRPVLYVILAILACFSISTVFFNGLSGTGATWMGLKIQFVWVLIYILSIYIVINYTRLGLEWAWATEIVYWLGVFYFTHRFLKNERWHTLKY